MAKIIVDRTSEIPEVIESIIDCRDAQLTLIIPKFSKIAELPSNFRLLKKQADILGKNLIIESVDNKVLELAQDNNIKADNPFVERAEDIADKVVEENGNEKKSKKKEDSDTSTFVEYNNKKHEIVLPKPKYESQRGPLLPRILKISMWTVISSGIIVGAAWYLPKADLKLITKKSEWTYNDAVAAMKNVETDAAKMLIPNQIFSQTKNFNLKFPATGKKQVQNKAQGEITIFNAYSSQSQSLVKNTRFTTSDGKIFRLEKNIVIPAAKIVDAKIVPSSIKANVIADAAGEGYNIGPTNRFTVPGFQGTPKFDGFYASSDAAMTGGYVGELAYPTIDDIKAAKENAAKSLETAIKTEIFSQIPSEFKILDGASQYTVLSQSVEDKVDGEGKFGIFTEAKVTIIVFKESDLQNVLGSRALSEKSNEFEVKSSELKYGSVRADFAVGKLSFTVNFTAVLAHKIDSQSLMGQVINNPEAELKRIIFSLPGLESANISFWPFWVSKVPGDPDKVQIEVD